MNFFCKITGEGRPFCVNSFCEFLHDFCTSTKCALNPKPITHLHQSRCVIFSFKKYINNINKFIWSFYFTTWNHVHMNPCTCDLCPNQKTLWPLMWLFSLAHGKNDLLDYIYNYKMALSCIFDYELWLMFVWTKMRMKNVVILCNN